MSGMLIRRNKNLRLWAKNAHQKTRTMMLFLHILLLIDPIKRFNRLSLSIKGFSAFDVI